MDKCNFRKFMRRHSAGKVKLNCFDVSKGTIQATFSTSQEIQGHIQHSKIQKLRVKVYQKLNSEDFWKQATQDGGSTSLSIYTSKLDRF
jgi:hypothetical protein